MRKKFSFVKYLSGIAFCLLLMISCKEDPCDTLICVNDGTCVDGKCQCPEGFIGPTCGIQLDPCLQKPCSEAGTQACVSNDGIARCDCKLGFEGELCETLWEDKFVGAYTSSELCDGENVSAFVAVDPGPNPRQVTFVNFNGQATDSTTAKVVANLVNSTVFDIYEQFMPFGRVTGAGTIEANGQINMNFQIITPTDTSACSAVLFPN